MTTYRLLIAIEHALPNWPLVDFRKKLSRRILIYKIQKCVPNRCPQSIMAVSLGGGSEGREGGDFGLFWTAMIRGYC
jgi:hypothetical protein